MNYKERIDWLDVVRGYGIIAVIVGHIATPIMATWFYTFHIPLFFFVSGYLFHSNYELSVFFYRKFRTLIIPYFCLIIPVLLNELLSSDDFSRGLDVFLLEISKSFVQKRYTPLWFISSLFSANVLFYCIIRCVRRPRWYFLISFLITLFPVFYWRNDGDSLPWNIDVTFFVMPFMAMGKVVSDHKEWKDFVIKKKWLFLFVFFLGNTFLGGLNYIITGTKVDLFYEKVEFEILTYISALCGIMFVCVLSCMKNINFLCYIGKNSILLFAWHLIIYNWLGCVYDYIGVFQPPLSMIMILVRDAVSLVCILAVLIPVNEFILNSRFRFILGR